ncbi:MAG: long-chain-fatty-acid--CoA ligase [Alphaproteobacteria bacterium]
MMDLQAMPTLRDIMRVQADKYGDQSAIWFEGRETSYQTLYERSNQVGNGLIAEGCKKDARVGFIGKNSDSNIEVIMGTFAAGTVLVGVNWRLAGPEIEYVLTDAGVEVLFVDPEFEDVIGQIAGNVPSLRKIIAMGGDHADWPGYTDWRDQFATDDTGVTVGPEDDVIQLYTSGTTGHPKGVQLTNDNYQALFQGAVDAGWADWNAGSGNLMCMPNFHVAGVNIALLGLAQGCNNIVLADVDPAAIIDLIPEHKIESAFMVPAVILFVMQMPNLEGADLSSLRMVIYGASPIAEDLLKSAQDRFKCDFVQVYGLTETAGGGTFLPPEAHDPALNKLRSCGKAVPGVEIRIDDGKGGEQPTGDVGEILIRSGIIMKGYWNRAEATAEAIDKDGWFHTGDAGYKDDEGYIYIHDRVKDMIVSGGENVYPAEVENALFGHPDIADVAVVGVPDDKWGEAVKAIVVLEPGKDASDKDIIAFAKEKIAGYKCPKTVDFIDALPRNPSGKILRRELRAPYWEGRERQVG